jgi:hypothetical protein
MQADSKASAPCVLWHIQKLSILTELLRNLTTTLSIKTLYITALLNSIYIYNGQICKLTLPVLAPCALWHIQKLSIFMALPRNVGSTTLYSMKTLSMTVLYGIGHKGKQTVDVYFGLAYVMTYMDLILPDWCHDIHHRDTQQSDTQLHLCSWL